MFNILEAWLAFLSNAKPPNIFSKSPFIDILEYLPGFPYPSA